MTREETTRRWITIGAFAAWFGAALYVVMMARGYLPEDWRGGATVLVGIGITLTLIRLNMRMTNTLTRTFEAGVKAERVRQRLAEEREYEHSNHLAESSPSPNRKEKEEVADHRRHPRGSGCDTRRGLRD